MIKKKQMPKVFPVTCHTDHVGPGTTFVAIEGYKEDGINYIPLALKNGASTIIVKRGTEISQELQSQIADNGASISFVENTRKTLADLSAKAAGYPAKQLKIIGITGTKGKTTTTYLVEHILKEAGYTTAHISSVDNAIAGFSIESCLTTPPADYIQQFLALCVTNRVDWVVMEVAAHALALNRITNIMFDGIIFTNFEREHLEFFSNIDEYFETKLKIFNHLKPGAPALINGDDMRCKTISTQNCNVKTFGLDNKNHDITALLDAAWEYHVSCIITMKNKNYKILCPTLLGRFNAYNIIAAVGLTLELGISMDTIIPALYSFEGVPGRQDQYDLPNKATAIVDYAHTPASFDAILSLLRLRTKNLIVVFGHGGERDKTKRPLLGAASSKYADLIILTSDNPRSENPQSIIDEIKSGIPKGKKTIILSNIDRARAIETAYQHSQRGSIIAILGKGTEETQTIGSKKIPYSDESVILNLEDPEIS